MIKFFCFIILNLVTKCAFKLVCWWSFYPSRAKRFVSLEKSFPCFVIAIIIIIIIIIVIIIIIIIIII